MVNVDFEDDLYILDSDFWCPNECWTQPPSYCACDYTKPKGGDCKKRRSSVNKSVNATNPGSSSSSPSESYCERVCAPESSEDYDLYCSTTPREYVGNVLPSRPPSGWMVLEDGVISRDHRMYRLNEEHYYRFFTSETCKYLRFVVTPSRGSLKLEIATPSTWADDFPFVYSSQRYSVIEFSICPTDPYFAPGTFYIRVTAASAYVEYSILVELVGMHTEISL